MSSSMLGQPAGLTRCSRVVHQRRSIASNRKCSARVVPGLHHNRAWRSRSVPDGNGSSPTVADSPAPLSPEPPTGEAASASLQQVREARIQPLREALNASIAQHTKATGVREALEAEVCALFESVITAEGTSDVNVEEVAAAAMAAVEGAVKDEVEAAAVVEATKRALATTLVELQVLDGSADAAVAAAAAGVLDAEAAAVASVEDAVATVLPSLSSADTASPTDTAQLIDALVPGAAAAGGGAAAAAGAGNLVRDAAGGLYPEALSSRDAAIAAATGRPPTPAEAQRKAQAKQRKQLLRLGAVVAGCVGLWYLVQSPALQALAAQAAEHIPPIHIGEAEQGLLQTIWLLLTSIICVPLVVKLIPGGSPVLGYLIGGLLVGPYALNIISDVHQVQHLAELGVVLLLFNIGLELSLDRLRSMAKMVFGMGAVQVLFTVLGVAAVATSVAGLPGPSAIILGGALAMSTTAVAIQVLEDRGEMGSRHGRATFSVLLFQDLAVVVLLMLIPLLAPDPSGASGGMAKIAKALALAGVKAVVCITGIIAGGRIFLRPLYKKIAGLANNEIFAATTLLVVLGTSLTTQLAGLSLALGAFLAGLLLAETEFALQVESDIAPYKGLLMGLFFMTVGMQISVGLFLQQWQGILGAMVVLVVGKLAVMGAAGAMFGVSRLATLRAGLLLATGGEFAFVAFGEAVAKGVLPIELTNQLYIVVALSMALVPYLAELGSRLGAKFERNDMKALQPQEGEVRELSGHVIVAGYGRVGQVITQMLSEELIPFVALDVRADRVQAGKSLDLPVYFGDAGSPAVLHQVGAERAACAVVTLDTPGANYRTVWALHKHFPHVKTYVKAHDINHGLNLEKAGASVVVPETLEPSLQLAAAVLTELNKPGEEVNAIVDGFRRKHLSELQAMASAAGTSLGYAPKKEKTEEPPPVVLSSVSGGDGAGAAPALSPAAA